MRGEIEGRAVRKSPTSLRTQTIGGETYCTVMLPKGHNFVIPVGLLWQGLVPRLDDPNFAVGVVDGQMLFIFRNRKDAKRFQKVLREVDPSKV